MPRAERKRKNVLLRSICAIEHGHHAAGIHDGDAVAHAEDLGQLRGDHDDSDTLFGEIDHEAVDLGLEPTSTPCVGSSSMRTAGLIASHRASATFCWLP